MQGFMLHWCGHYQIDHKDIRRPSTRIYARSFAYSPLGDHKNLLPTLVPPPYTPPWCSSEPLLKHPGTSWRGFVRIIQGTGEQPITEAPPSLLYPAPSLPAYRKNEYVVVRRVFNISQGSPDGFLGCQSILVFSLMGSTNLGAIHRIPKIPT